MTLLLPRGAQDRFGLLVITFFGLGSGFFNSNQIASLFLIEPFTAGRGVVCGWMFRFSRAFCGRRCKPVDIRLRFRWDRLDAGVVAPQTGYRMNDLNLARACTKGRRSALRLSQTAIGIWSALGAQAQTVAGVSLICPALPWILRSGTGIAALKIRTREPT
jgi:hypothetical protein